MYLENTLYNNVKNMRVFLYITSRLDEYMFLGESNFH